MSLPIQLSLVGDGRLVVLTPQTFRTAFFQFTQANPEYTGRERYRLNQPMHCPVKLWKRYSKGSHFYRPYWDKPGDYKDQWKESEATLLDALHRVYYDPKNLLNLHFKDIQKIENEINQQIIVNNLALVKDEGRLLEGYGVVKGRGKNREKIKYIYRYGMIFIVEAIKRETVLRTENLDLFLQDYDFEFHLVRYHGLVLSNLRSSTQLLFRHRLDFSRTSTCTLAQFQPRQIFRVKRIYPHPGFRIINYC